MNCEEIQFLFLHAGGFNKKGLQGPIFPIGIIGLASLLQKNGYKPYIINTFLEQIIDPKIDLKKFLSRFWPKVICIDLHWFVHSYESIELARLCRNVFPDARILLGGLTSSHFDEEILANFPFIDYIIRGDAEKPIMELADILINNVSKSLKDIPNLSFRDEDGKIIRNPQSFIASSQDLDDIDFLKFDLVKDWEQNIKLINTDYIPYHGLKRTENLREYYLAAPIKSWILYSGRGCNYNCSFCGGAFSAYEKAFGRRIVLRSPEKIAKDILRFDEMGFDIIYIPHSPLIGNREHHMKFLDILEKANKKLKLGFIFEDCPFDIDMYVIDRYLSIFDPKKSIIRLYLSDTNRLVAKFNNFPSELSGIKALIEKHGRKVRIMAGALIGLPGQTRESTVRMGKTLKSLKDRGVRTLIFNAELHPGSEIHSYPEKYKTDIELRTFMDYYNYLKDKNEKSMTYGYKTLNDVTLKEQDEILRGFIGGRFDWLRNIVFYRFLVRGADKALRKSRMS